MASTTDSIATPPAAGAPALNEAAFVRDGRREKRQILGLSVPALIVVTGLLLVPVGWLFALAFVSGGESSLVNFQRMIDYPAYAAIFRTTFEVSVAVTVLCILLGYPVAYLLAQLPPRLATVGLAFVVIPFWTSLLVRTYAWLVLLQRRGVINDALISAGLIDEPLRLVHNFTGTMIGMVHIMLPFLVLPLYATLRTIDGDLIRAATSCGASPIQAFFRVFLPLSMPGLIAGTLLVFILSLGFYVTPAILGGGRVTMVSMKIQQNVSVYFDWGSGSALGLVLLLAVFAIFYAVHRFAGLDRIFRG
ncbi:ABC transporter permease [Kaustia mangrovi]|uniref:ABC transporter permease n=1 Tax=Kaustia mangrovi TaxID=2593653 RepID=A0A7S8HBH1_9HYPH|nr:ABC transporter permease [Kaustia mangrovi]QPC42627.1 ABC transporter permease [Kaustia mangrovi]